VKPQRCRCGRTKSEHYTVQVRRKRRFYHDCKQFRPAGTGPPGQLQLSMPDADNPQVSRGIVFAHETTTPRGDDSAGTAKNHNP
jgi:hypothetical protein